MKNTSYLRVLLVVIFTILIIPQPGCRKKEPPEPEPEPEIIIAENTKIISNQDWMNYLESIDSTDFTITFNTGINQKHQLAVGDVIVSTAGYGLIRKVTGITEEGGKIIVTTEQARLSDAVPKGELKFNVNIPNPGQYEKIEYIAKGVKVLNEQDRSMDKLALVISSDFGTDFFSVEGEVDITDFQFEGDYKWHSVVGIPPVVLDTAYGSFSLQQNFTLTEELSKSAEFKKTVHLLTVPYGTITVFIGPVPVVITPKLVIEAGVQVEAKSSLSAGVTEDLTVSGGLSYDGSHWHPSFDLDKELSAIPPSLDNTLEAKVFIKPKLVMVIQFVFKPNVSVQPYAELDAELGASPWWQLYLGIRSDIEMAIDMVVAEMSVSHNLFDEKYEVANSGGGGGGDNQPPTASFTVTPEEGNIGTVFHFNASDCDDDEDMPEDLQVRWDWQNDGIWDTEYTTEKEADHSYSEGGNYTVKLEVKDTDGATDETTRDITVSSNHSPEAAFTVNTTIGTVDTVFVFDAGLSSDDEDPSEDLKVRWDWDGDGYFDTDFSYEKQITHQYSTEDEYTVILEVVDKDGSVSQCHNNIFVNEIGAGAPCPGAETVEYGGQIYHTVQIGNQCWMKENLNIGEMITSSHQQTDNGIIEKYCYDNDPDNCEKKGGLYQWDEIMQYMHEEGSQGICPPGWHIPTKEEWNILEGTTDSRYGIGDSIWEPPVSNEWCGFDVGKRLKTKEGWVNYPTGLDSYGFSIIPSGYVDEHGKYYGGLYNAHFWTSTEFYGVDAYYRGFYGGSDFVLNSGYSKKMAYSVRCIKDQ